MRMLRALTRPPSEMMPTSVVPPPISITMLPVGSCTGSSMPIAAAIGSSTICTSRAPAPLPRRYAGRNTHDDPRPQQLRVPRLCLVDEIGKHLARYLEVGDDAVDDRLPPHAVRRRTPEHILRFLSDGDYLSRLLIQRDDGRLVDDDATPFDVHERDAFLSHQQG